VSETDNSLSPGEIIGRIIVVIMFLPALLMLPLAFGAYLLTCAWNGKD
jgi:hypothetical protein